MSLKVEQQLEEMQIPIGAIPVNTVGEGLLGLAVTFIFTSANPLVGGALGVVASLVTNLTFKVFHSFVNFKEFSPLTQLLVRVFLIEVPLRSLIAVAFVYLGLPIALETALAVLSVAAIIISLACLIEYTFLST